MKEREKCQTNLILITERNQLNPNNDAYYQSRGYEDKADYDNQNSYDDYNDEWDDDDYFAQPDEDEWDPYEENYEYED